MTADRGESGRGGSRPRVLLDREHAAVLLTLIRRENPLLQADNRTSPKTTVNILRNKDTLMIVVLHQFLALLAFSVTAFAQEDVIRVETELVTLPVTVLDRSGRHAENLHAENFKIFENGIEQKVAFFNSEREPLSVFLLLDNSGSMDKQLGELAAAANVFVNKLRPDDQIIVGLFDNWVDVVADRTSAKDLRSRVIDVRRQRGSPAVTMVYDAVEFALKRISKARGRKALILFSDGVGSGYMASARSNLRDAQEGEALIYTIQFSTYSGVAPRNVSEKKYFKDLQTADAYMQNLAEVTGGRRIKVKEISNLGAVFSDVAGELGQQYLLGYYPKQTGKKGERREIKVTVDLPGAAVRARSSYVVGSPKK